MRRIHDRNQVTKKKNFFNENVNNLEENVKNPKTSNFNYFYDLIISNIIIYNGLFCFKG